MNDSTPDQLAARAREAMQALAARPEPEAFQELLALSQLLGECIGESARSLAAASSWTQVATYSRTTKQAAWSRWRA